MKNKQNHHFLWRYDIDHSHMTMKYNQIGISLVPMCDHNLRTTHEVPLGCRAHTVFTVVGGRRATSKINLNIDWSYRYREYNRYFYFHTNTMCKRFDFFRIHLFLCDQLLVVWWGWNVFLIGLVTLPFWLHVSCISNYSNQLQFTLFDKQLLCIWLSFYPWV